MTGSFRLFFFCALIKHLVMEWSLLRPAFTCGDFEGSIYIRALFVGVRRESSACDLLLLLSTPSLPDRTASLARAP